MKSTRCEECNGTGVSEAELSECEGCEGTGVVEYCPHGIRMDEWCVKCPAGGA